MSFNALFLLSALVVYVMALPMPLTTKQNHKIKHHKLAKMSPPTATNGTLKATALWSTSPGVPGAVPLNFDAFKATAVMKDAKPTFTTAPDGSDAMQVHFSKGSYDYHGPPGGVSFYAKPIDLSNAKEVTLSYSVFFEEGFDFNLGGKLPGLYGGDDEETSLSCSGGRRDVKCWSARFMFRPGGAGELYTYLPQPSDGPQFLGNKKLCGSKDENNCNPTYGASIARGEWTWTPNEWHNVTQTITLNDPDQGNGKLKVVINGRTVVDLEGLGFRNSAKGRFEGVMFQVFFGGHEPVWGSPKDQNAYFKDVSVKIDRSLDTTSS